MLIQTFDTALTSGDLEIAHDLRELSAFKDEIAIFRRRISATGHVGYEAAPGKHDDMIIAVALAVWHASQPRGAHMVSLA